MSDGTGGLRAWIRWEFGRRIEVTGFIKFIIIERFVKGTALVLGGISLLILGATGALNRFLSSVQEQLVLNPGQGFFHHLWTRVAVDFGKFSGGERNAVAAAAICYGLLESFEGFGLILRRRWAEYLVLVATVAFIPLEVDEVLSHFTVLKLGTLIVNIGIAVYLVWRKRLFLERPGEPPVADRGIAPRPPEA